MIISAVNERSLRNLESASVDELIPSALRTNAAALIEFIKEYYRHLNTVGLPSYEISHITSEHDIDKASTKYLNAIQNEIAKGVPNSAVLDRVALYKRIVKYYQMRGSEESIVIFFRIFFDELVEIFYPKDFLFIPSSGAWAATKYSNRKGFPSDQYKIRDSRYWQEFAYEVRSALSMGAWVDDFKKMVHPSGMNLFAAMVIQLFRSNIWDEEIDYSAKDPDTSYEWLLKLMPPWMRPAVTNSEGFHTPKYQPGWLEGNARFLKFLLSVVYWTPDGEPNNDTAHRVRAVFLSMKYLLDANTLHRNILVRREYQSFGKFLDEGCAISSYATATIAEAMAPYKESGNACPFLNMSAVHSGGLTWAPASVEDSVPDNTDADWDTSGIDAEAPLLGDYESCTIVPLDELE